MPLRPTALLLAALPLAAAAQTTPAPADTARLYRTQFGLTASPQLDHFFTANRSLPLGVLYQRRLTATKALRLRLVGQYSYADSTNFKDDVFGVINADIAGPCYGGWHLSAFAGYVWQRGLSRHFALDYGLEAGIGYQRQHYYRARREIYAPGGYVVDYFERLTQTYSGQVRGFAGVSYRPVPRLRLFAEMGLPLTYTHQRLRYQVQAVFTKPDEADRFLNERAIANRVSLAWRPVQFVGASYAF